MKYSVVIPMYNSENTIEKAIDSILKQSRYDLIDEIIIVNDGSTDDSLKIVKEIAKTKNIIKIIDKKNGGAASARNAGIKASKNNWIALLDSDDEWLPQKIEIQNRCIEHDVMIKAVGSNRIGEKSNIGQYYSEGIRKVSAFQYCIKCWPCTPSIVFDKSLFEKDLYFPEDMSHAEEGLFFLNLASGCGLYYCEEELVYCGDGKRAFGSSGLSGDIREMHRGVKKMIVRASDEKYISKFVVPPLLLFEDLKYLRRKFLSRRS